VTCETGPVTVQPLVLATLDGYAVEGGFDRPHEPSTCYRPTIALGRHDGPGDGEGLWGEYEAVVDLASTLGLDGLRLSVEWARVEPRRGEVDEAALDRYAVVAQHARSRGLGVTVAIVDAAWPAWLGLEAWLLPWVVPDVLAQARRVLAHLRGVEPRLLMFTDPEGLVSSGYLNASAPPWRRGAGDDAASARAQMHEILRLAKGDPLLSPAMVGDTHTVGAQLAPEQIARERLGAARCEEFYVRSLVRGSGPSAAGAGLLERRGDGWTVRASPQLLAALS
jgi:beta-glucosidase/6-phospho-beta-glucosidase/beta-galactosidase